ncbi:hypothetical protein [Neoroseomonas lacus]|uniref:Uncharacterized protein n=1 Tax=Neoroseomonas lacus TaxID=287609 RepID=A0A917KTQ6_9PROT|nr:hypothetical protein [Neoroseomonas lacus]GGJ26577.1 hypothetical protein GCM10011320_37540 [Neoroseomonas lacus]
MIANWHAPPGAALPLRTGGDGPSVMGMSKDVMTAPSGGAPAPEPRWPVALTIFGVLIIAAAMPDRLTLLPPWAPLR